MQEKSFVNILNSKISNIVKDKHQDKRRISGMENAKRVQGVLDEYAKRLRDKKLELLERYITEGLQMLLHKKQFIDKVSIDNKSFEVRLFKGDDEISKEMLSKGELQMFATAVVWGLAKTSGRPLPFMIDTPLARLDEEHRENLVEKFYPYASHQLIIFSTNSEINRIFYPKLEPFIERSFVIKYDSDKGKTEKHDNYFFDSEGEKIIEI
jgi:DNA sulfur modification protein DndD